MGRKIYKAGSKFEVQAEENRLKEEAGEHVNKFGNLLFSSMEEAKEYIAFEDKREKANAETQRKNDEIAAKKADQEAKRMAVFDYLNDKTPMQKQRAINHLENCLNYNGKSMTHQEMVHVCLDQGMKPEVKLANNKNKYIMRKDNSYADISKTQYDYALSKIN